MSNAYKFADTNGRPSITHLECGMTSHHPRDVEYRYCAWCHRFLDDPPPTPTPEPIENVQLFAWVGESELGDDVGHGLKQARCAAGMIPMVATRQDKMAQDYIVAQLRVQVAIHRKTIRLVRFTFAEVLMELEPPKERKA